MFIIFLLLFAATLNAQGAGIVSPDPPLLEKDEYGQYLNCDFVFNNSLDEAITLNSVELRVYDGKNRLVLRRILNQNGMGPAIDSVGKREIEARSSFLFYNPQFEFPVFVELSRVRFEFTFQSKNSEKFFYVEVEARPLFYETKSDLILPLQGKILAHEGHEYYNHHRRVDPSHPFARQLGVTANFTRYAYDFCAVNEKGELYKNDGKKREEWYGYGIPIYAPADGKVVSFWNEMADNEIGQVNLDEAQMKERPLSAAGNYVILDHGNGEFSLLAHMKPGTVRVKTGNQVKQGQQLGEMGSSGDGDIPHLHYQMQKGADFSFEGLPVYFRDFVRANGSGSQQVKRGLIHDGEFIESAAKQ